VNRRKTEIQKYNTVDTIPTFNNKVVERGKIDISNTQIHKNSLAGTSNKSGGVKLVLLPKPPGVNYV
jgi:hypothetical protein